MLWWWWKTGLTLLYDAQKNGTAGVAKACSEMPVYMTGGTPPYSLHGFYFRNSNFSDIKGFPVDQNISDNVYMCTVTAPIQSSLFLTLTDSNNVTITGTRVLSVVSNRKGRSADTWCLFDALDQPHPTAPTNGSKLQFNDTDTDGVDGYGNSSSWNNKTSGVDDGTDDENDGVTETPYTSSIATKTSITAEDESDHIPTGVTSFISDLENRSHIIESTLGSLVAVTFTACILLLLLLLRLRRRYKRMEASLASGHSQGHYAFNPPMHLQNIVTEKPGMLSGQKQSSHPGANVCEKGGKGQRHLLRPWRSPQDVHRDHQKVIPVSVQTPSRSEALRNPFDDANASPEPYRHGHIGLIPTVRRYSRSSLASSLGGGSSQGGYLSSTNTADSDPHSAYSTEHYHRTKASTMIHPHTITTAAAPISSAEFPRSSSSTASSTSGGESSEANTVIVPITRVPTNQSTTTFDSSGTGGTSLTPASIRNDSSDDGVRYGARAYSRGSYRSSPSSSADDLRYGTSFWSEGGDQYTRNDEDEDEDGAETETETEGRPHAQSGRRRSTSLARPAELQGFRPSSGLDNDNANPESGARRTPHFWQ